MTDLEKALVFFKMLEKKGVQTSVSNDDGIEITIKSRSSQAENGDTLTFCFDEDTHDFNRIMGYVGRYYSDEIFKL